MQVPVRRAGLRASFAVKAPAVEPIALSPAVFDAVIVAGLPGQARRPGLHVAPPLRRDAFRAVAALNPMRDAAPTEQHGRAVGHFGHRFDRLGVGQEVDRAAGDMPPLAISPAA